MVSEATLIAVLAIRLLPAPAGAMAATCTGGMVSHVLSRSWISATDFLADHASGPHPARVAEAVAACLATCGLLWIAKFLVYQRVILRPANLPDPA